jgi:hypothetical protein
MIIRARFPNSSTHELIALDETLIKIITVFEDETFIEYKGTTLAVITEDISSLID